MSCKDFIIANMLFDYCEETGVLSWKERSQKCSEILGTEERYRVRFNRHKAGTVLRSTGTHGYIQVTVNTRSFQFSGPVHRVIWLMHFGYWPSTVDHIDRDKQNNRLTNLREVSNTENRYNVGPRNDNTSGFTGVSFSKHRQKWRAYFTKDGKQCNLGWFPTKALAVRSRLIWESESTHIFG